MGKSAFVKIISRRYKHRITIPAMFDWPFHFMFYEAEGGWCEIGESHVGRLDRINPYPADKCWQNNPHYPMDRDLSGV